MRGGYMCMSRARKNKRGSLNHQIHKRMEELKCIGQSRKQAVEEAKTELGYKHNRSIGIHSYNTYSKDMAAINKIFNFEITKEDCNVANRSYLDITNNREMKEHHNHINYSNYANEIAVLRATGMRRESLEKISYNSFNYDDKGYPVSLRLVDERANGGENLKEKNGRERIAEIVEDRREELKNILESKLEASNNPDEKLFSDVSNKLGTHRFRQEYAKEMYNQYLDKYGADTVKLKDIMECEKNGDKTTFRGYDIGALKYATENLGHNRISVIVYNYLRANGD